MASRYGVHTRRQAMEMEEYEKKIDESRTFWLDAKVKKYGNDELDVYSTTFDEDKKFVFFPILRQLTNALP